MNLDPTTELLVVFALIPGRWIRFLLGPVTEKRGWFALICVSFFMGVLFFKPPMPAGLLWLDFVLMQGGSILANLSCFLLFAARFGRSDRPRGRWWPLLILAALWTMQLMMVMDVPAADAPDGLVRFWFLDFFNKLFLTFAEPVLGFVGLSQATAPLLSYLQTPLVLLSDNLWGLHYWASFLAAYLLYRLFTPQIRGFDEAPPITKTRVPFSIIAVALLCLWMKDSFPPAIFLWKVLGPLLVFRGVFIAFHLLPSWKTAKIAFLLALIATMVHPILLWAWGILTVVDSVLGWKEGRVGRMANMAISPAQNERMLALVRRTYRPVTILVYLIQFAGLPIDEMRFGTHHMGPNPAFAAEVSTLNQQGQQAQFPSRQGGIMAMDKYEYPNQKGGIPLTGLRPKDAQARCESLGKELCSHTAWYDACSHGGAHPYLLADMRYDFGEITDPSAIKNSPSLADLRQRCNLWASDKSTVLEPSGQRKDCHGKLPAFDLTGNAFEWIPMDNVQGFWGLAGSYYGYRDVQSMRCEFRILVHEAQLDSIDLDAVGFRCCSSKAP